MREYRIAAIPGDGIGLEVIATGLEVLDHVSLWGLRLPICQGFDQYAKRVHTPDIGGEATTAIVTEAVCESL